jgi:hypothetical protein
MLLKELGKNTCVMIQNNYVSLEGFLFFDRGVGKPGSSFTEVVKFTILS